MEENKYVPTEEFLKECGFEYRPGTPNEMESYRIIFEDLELRYNFFKQEFQIWEGDILTEQGVVIMQDLFINSDTELLTFLKIIGTDK